MKIILTTFDEFDVVATVEDGQEAVAYCEAHEVDVALMDVRMPNLNGVEAAKQLTERTRTKTLILTTFDDDEYITDAILNGAKGYLLKNNDPERIRDAIKTVYHGHHVLQDVVLIESNPGCLPESLTRKIRQTSSTGVYSPKGSWTLWRSSPKGWPTRKFRRSCLFPKARLPITSLRFLARQVLSIEPRLRFLSDGEVNK